MHIDSRSYAIPSIYSLVVGNMPQGKRHTSRTEPALVQAYCIRLKFTSPQEKKKQGARSVRCILQPEKRLRKRR